MVNVSLAFLSTPSARRATRTHGSHFILNGDFYPRPPRGGRPYALPSLYSTALFLSTPSARRATSGLQRYCPECANFYPRPPRGGRPGPGRCCRWFRWISIHALREEGDHKSLYAARLLIISIHALREEGDFQFVNRFFQLCYFYPRPPRGGRRPAGSGLRESEPFLSTPSARRATMPLRRCSLRPAISIHALREEGDQRAARADRSASDFYPRPPRGGRHIPPCAPSVPHQFLSTPSARRATSSIATNTRYWEHFYPRPPRGGRQTQKRHTSRFWNFYPRPPRGGRLQSGLTGAPSNAISIHALREEGDWAQWAANDSARKFLSTPSARRATMAFLTEKYSL